MNEERLWEMWRTLARIYGELASLPSTDTKLDMFTEDALQAITRAQDCFYFNRPGEESHIYLDGEEECAS